MKSVPLSDVRHVLLDMDGTLLDRYFDDYFWGHLVPEKYALKHDMTFGKARAQLMETYRRQEGTLNWTDIDYWSRELHLDIPALKEQVRHLIEVHPHVVNFLEEMLKQGKQVHLFTNAHYKTVGVKFKKTGLGKYFHSIVTSNEIGMPKEDMEFWHRAQRQVGFDCAHTMFVDDNTACLRPAREFGIKYVIFKGRASSVEGPRVSEEFLYITDFNELLED